MARMVSLNDESCAWPAQSPVNLRSDVTGHSSSTTELDTSSKHRWLMGGPNTRLNWRPHGCNPPRRLPATPRVPFSGRRVDEPTETSDWGAMWCDVTWRGHWLQQQTSQRETTSVSLSLAACHQLLDFPVNVAVPPDVTVLSSDQAVRHCGYSGM